MIAIFTPVLPFLVRPHAPPECRDIGMRIGVVLHDRLAARKLLDLLPGHSSRLDELRHPEMIVHEWFAGHAAGNEIDTCDRCGGRRNTRGAGTSTVSHPGTTDEIASLTQDRR